MDPGSEISDDVLYEITWSAFYFAADTLLDMLLYIKQNKKETSKTKSKVISQGQHRGKTSAHAPNYENMAGNLNINF
jgi:hypothetical protein